LDVGRFGLDALPLYLTIALVASGMKVGLQGVTGTMSMSFLFVLIGVSEVGLSGTLLMGCLGMLVQCIFRAKIRPRPVQILFSVASMACSVEACYVHLRHVIARRVDRVTRAAAPWLPRRSSPLTRSPWLP
jgi:hypothetical protein